MLRGILYTIKIGRWQVKSYKEQRKSAAEIGTQAEKGMGGSSAEELTAKIAAAYNGKSNGDMMRGILAEAERSKRAGTLSNAEIENFYKTFSPMLDTTQRRRLRGIVDKLKEL